MISETETICGNPSHIWPGITKCRKMTGHDVKMGIIFELAGLFAIQSGLVEC